MRANIKISFAIVFFIFLMDKNFAQNYISKIYGLEEGLPQSQVLSLLISKNEFLWCGTNGGGAVRFDGKNFFILDEKKGLLDNIVSAICEDQDGGIWFGTLYGAARFYKNKVAAFGKSYGFTRVMSIKALPDGKILLADFNNGLFVYDKGKIKRFLLGDSAQVINLRNIYIDASGNAYLCSHNGIYVFKNEKIEQFKFNAKLTNKVVRDVYVDEKGSFWIGHQKGFDIIVGEKVYSFNAGENKLGSMVRTFFVDKQNTMYIGTDAGVFLVHRENSDDEYKISFEKIYPAEKNDNIIQITKDNFGNLWLASGANGLIKLSLSNFTNYLAGVNFPSDNIWTINQLNDGSIYFGDYYGGIFFKKNNNISTLKLNYHFDRINSIEKDKDGNLWIGGNLLLKYDGKQFIEYSEKDGIAFDVIINIYCDSKGSIWIGTWGGAYKYENKKFYNLEEINRPIHSAGVYYFYEDNEGKIWLCTRQAGVKYFKDEILYEFKFPEKFNSIKYFSIYQDNYGNYWFANYGKGLVWHNPKTGEFKEITTNDGLANNSVLAIIKDKKGIIWVGTNNGISAIDPKRFLENTHPFVISFGKEEGFLGEECNQNSIMVDSENNVWFGHIKGVSVIKNFDFSKYKISLSKKPIITDFKIFFESLNTSDYKDEELNLYGLPKKVYLNYNENHITIEFLAIDFRSPDKIKFQYVLEGAFDKWTPPTSNNYVTFSNLSPGFYVFKVKTSNSENEYDSISFEISAPFYQTKTFIFVSILFIFGTFLSVYKIRTAAIKRRNRELTELIETKKLAEKALIEAKENAEKSDKLKSEFLAQMSHEIRTPMNAILSFISYLETELKGKIDKEYEEVFDLINNGARRLIRTIDSILNMSQIQSGSVTIIKRKVDIFYEILCPLYEEFRRPAECKNLKFQMENNASSTITCIDDYMMSQIFIQLLDNAIKYTNRGGINIKLEDYDGKIKVEVEDTGVGISEEYLKVIFTPFTQEETGYTRKFDGNGLGLAIAKKYCEYNNIDIKVESQKSKGTKFILYIPKLENS